MMKTKAGNNWTLDVTVYDKLTGKPKDMTGATFIGMVRPDGGVLGDNVAGAYSEIDLTTGDARFTWSADEIATAGDWDVEVEATLGGEVQTVFQGCLQVDGVIIE